MRMRWLFGGWLLLGAALWAGIFEVNVDHGVQRFLLLRAEADLGLRDAPSMASLMAEARRSAAVHASIWSTLVVAAGWVTAILAARTSQDHRHRGGVGGVS